jgi:thiamine biosynthesis lipoprotein
MRRRRFLAVAAALGALAATPARAFRLDPVEWRGTALGAAASLVIHHEDRTEALRLLGACLAEIERFERIFSLYRDESSLVRLNRDGRLEAPPLDLLDLLGQADRLWRLSDGAFDPTVQPLWQAYVHHFSIPGAPPGGPAPQVLAQLRPVVDWGLVRLSEQEVSFARPGMALTLNGIAQGYVTDRVTELLRRAGMRHVLVNMGEIRGLGGPWRVEVPGGRVTDLGAGAVAISAADGTRFSATCHHLFDPAACRSSAFRSPVTIRGPTATTADAVATACAVSPAIAAHLAARTDCQVLPA